MSAWENSKWRQGSVCSRAALITAVLEGAQLPEGEFFVVASHDCDIANSNLEKEPFIEFFPAKHVKDKDGNYLFGKNPRKLHMGFLKAGTSSFLELEAITRFSLRKEDLQQIAPSDEYRLETKDKRILQNWLAARYRRHAFPNGLVKILENEKFWEMLVKKPSPQTAGVVQRFLLHCEPDEDIECGERYELELLIVHDGTKDSEKYAEEIAQRLKEASRKIKDIDLSRCEARSAAEVTLEDLEYYETLNLDHISYKYGYWV